MDINFNTEDGILELPSISNIGNGNVMLTAQKNEEDPFLFVIATNDHKTHLVIQSTSMNTDGDAIDRGRFLVMTIHPNTANLFESGAEPIGEIFKYARELTLVNKHEEYHTASELDTDNDNDKDAFEKFIATTPLSETGGFISGLNLIRHTLSLEDVKDAVASGEKLVGYQFEVRVPMSKGIKDNVNNLDDLIDESLNHNANFNTRKQVVPAAGCDVIIGGSSCHSTSIYEVGGFALHDYYDHLGHVNSFGFCLEKNLDEVKGLFHDRLETLIADKIEQRQSEIEALTYYGDLLSKRKSSSSLKP